jgi:hypothetical protein
MSMPEKGWSILTVRDVTARKVKERAHGRGLTVDELINELMSPSGKAGWLACSLCGAKVKSKNLQEHMAKVHPRNLG